MSTYDSTDDEDWSDDDSDLDDEESIDCPECAGEISSHTDKCPHCGYWLTPADRRRRPSQSTPAWQRLTAALLVAIFLFLLLAGLDMF